MFTRRILFEGKSDFGSYKVEDTIYDGRRARLLYGGHHTPQSGVALDGQPELLFDYNQRFLEIAQSLQPKNILVIGGGAFTLPLALLRYFPSADISVVEIDALLVDIARRFFDLPAQHERLHVHVGDGRHFIDHVDEQYDLIIIDAFSEFLIPRPLYSSQAVRQYARILSPGGVLAMNAIARYKGTKLTLAHQLVATFCTGFAAVSIYPADYTYPSSLEQNLLVVASSDPEQSLSYLHSQTVELDVMPENAIVTDTEDTK